MVKLEVDGRQTEVPRGAMIMEAAVRLGIFVPHFCYHKKLSIAANCRMCLVEVEKAPKPLPACATPVMEGMKVWTQSEQAKRAQNSVMEFLLINHPLDCPICDQGGECQLQDLAVGYGKSASRYSEEKRVVLHKNLGPLISAEEMTRCIHCTRCVRFGQEIAGVMELGMVGRGEHAEIVSFVGATVDSELSGNMIDLCPVGALTSKPFRYCARTWELARRRSVSPHDGLGANLIVQVKNDRVMRVVPFENEEINECWLSDKDRFAYEGVNSDERLTKPMLREGGAWREVGWEQALEHVVANLQAIKAEHGAQSIGALASPHATFEELALLAKLARGLGCENVDFRLRQWDFSADGKRSGAPWLGMKIADIGSLDRVLVVGSFLRKDHPLIANRLRQAAKRGQQVNLIHAADDELLIALANKAIVAPAELPAALAQVLRAVAEAKQKPVPAAAAQAAPNERAKAIAQSLVSGTNIAIFLGNLAQQHASSAQIELLAQELAGLLGARHGFLGEAANSVGGYVANCVPGPGGLNARAMLEDPRKSYLLLQAEPELDCANPALATAAIAQAKFVVALASYRGRATDCAQVLLPISPFTETAGSFINNEGRLQSFNGVVRPLGESRPGWKVLRVLGNLLGLPGFGYESSEAVRDEACPAQALPARLGNRVSVTAGAPAAVAHGALQRVTDVPIYFADPIVRRARSLQQTRDARPPKAAMNAATIAKLGLAAGAKVKLRQDAGEAVLELGCDEGLPAGCVRVAAAHASTAGLGAMAGEISVERA
ncbi:MAG: NADH-quinone oxidoreductase subunit G [Betaproteobacteria bacterium]|nr:NADH-quinone oxidoreductase subunit G [Betaproteobacteria bacterium]